MRRIQNIVGLVGDLVFPLLRAGLGRAGAISLPATLLLVHFVLPVAACVGWVLGGLLGAGALGGVQGSE